MFLCRPCDLLLKIGRLKKGAPSLSLWRLAPCGGRPSVVFSVWKLKAFSGLFWHVSFLGLCVFFFPIFPYTWLILYTLISIKVSSLLLLGALDVLLYSSACSLLPLSGYRSTVFTHHGICQCFQRPSTWYSNYATLPIWAPSQTRQKPVPQAAPRQAGMLQTSYTIFLLSQGGAWNWVASSWLCCATSERGWCKSRQKHHKMSYHFEYGSYCLGICWLLQTLDYFKSSHKTILVCCLLDVSLKEWGPGAS